MATAAAPRVYKNFINGEWVEASGGKAYENRNPANSDELVGMFVSSTSEDVDAAVDAAKEAYKSWRLMPAPKRAEILYRTAELLVQRKEEFSKDMTREMGKVLAETRGDVQEAIDMTYYMAGEGRRLFGQTTPSELPNKFAMSVRQSIGVCGMITPWNFPMAIPAWKMMPALVSGNTVVLKPAEDTPLSSYHLIQTLTEAGLPRGVVNLVSGDGPNAGAGRGKYRGFETGGGYAAFFVSLGSDIDGGRIAARRGESGKRRWAECGSAAFATQRSSGAEFYRVHSGGTDYCGSVRAGFQARFARNGRQEHHHRDGRRQS